MRHFIFSLMLMLGAFSMDINAQKLYVYETVGDIKLVKGKIASSITVRQELTMKSIINIKKGSRLVLIDTEYNKQYTLSAAGIASIENFIAKASSKSIKQLNARYMEFIMKQINGNGVLVSNKAIDGGYASIERGDSIDEVELPDSIHTEEHE